MFLEVTLNTIMLYLIGPRRKRKWEDLKDIGTGREERIMQKGQSGRCLHIFP